jgi:hypothetical protein
MAKKNRSSLYIDQLESDLRQEFPSITITRTHSSIRIPSYLENGFSVELVDAEVEIVPALGKWVHYGLDYEPAILIFQAGLRGEARLHEISRAGVAYHWRVEFFRNGVWVKEKNDYYSFPLSLLLFLPFFFFWRKNEKILWNDPKKFSLND